MKKIIKWILLISVILLFSVVLSSIVLVELTNLAQTQENKKYNLGDRSFSCAGAIMVVQEVSLGGGVWRPITAGGEIIYCIEPGTRLPASSITKQMIDIWSTETSSSDHGCASDCPHKGYQSTTYYMCSGQHYTESSSYGGYTDLYEVGFILSYSMDSFRFSSTIAWEETIQQAIWWSPICRRAYGPQYGKTNHYAQGVALYSYATNYKDFFQKIMEKDEETGETGIKAKDLTDHSKIKLDTDTNPNENSETESKIHKLGPFKLDYVNGYYNGLSFGGIYDMYLVDNNGQRIDIKAFIRTKYDDNATITSSAHEKVYTNYGEPRFFTNYEELYEMYNVNLVDFWAILSYYPDPEEEFYVEFEYVGKDTSSLTLHVEFKWLVCEAEFCLREGIFWSLEQDEKHTSHTDWYYWGTDDEGNEIWYSYPCYSCYKSLRIKANDAQDTVLSVGARRYYEYDSLVIPITNLNMKIGGYVYEEYTENKEGTTNGIRDEGDIGLANVEVALYDAETNELVELNAVRDEMTIGYLKELKREENETDEEYAKRKAVFDKKVEEIKKKNEELEEKIKEREQDKDDYTRRTNPTLTDENGYYEFRGVSTEGKYYVQFTYNGQTYTAAEYLSKLIETENTQENGTTQSNNSETYSYNSVKEMVEVESNQEAIQYDGPSNEGVNIETQRWKETSKGTEKTSERNAFDEMFSSIGSSPENYKSTNSLQLQGILEGDNYNETFNTYELAGFTLNQEGNYVYSADNQLVDTYYDISRTDGLVIDTRDTEYKSEGKTVLTEGLITKTIKNYIDNKNIEGNDLAEGSQYENKEHKYPTQEIMKNFIYKQIVDKLSQNDQNKQKEIWKKLQFIEDTKINSYTKGEEVEKLEEFDQYPVYDKFTTYIVDDENIDEQAYYKPDEYPDNSYYNPTKDYDKGTYDEEASTYENHLLMHNGNATYGELIFDQSTGDLSYKHTALYNDVGKIVYKNVYPGQLEINQGLVRRQKYDVALKKDVYKATLKINGRTEIYDYDERGIVGEEERTKLKQLEEQYGRDSQEYIAYQQELENKYWEIQERMQIYDTYYGETYSREIYQSDKNYTGNNQLEAYVTYKITIQNQSNTNILTQIDEIVDYYDKTYTFEPNLSWVMYREKDFESYSEIAVIDQEFYDIMAKDDYVKPNKYRNVTIGENYNTETGQYSKNTQYTLNGYNTLYVNGLSNHKLKAGENAYVYLTFKVNGLGPTLSLESSNTASGKQNIAEVNGYTTYYTEGTKLPNGVEVKDDKIYQNGKVIRETAHAGLIDIDSNPGNFDQDAFDNKAENMRYEQNFEDDADRARGINIYVDTSLIRKISGTAWEDKRTYQPDGTEALVGNGVRETGEATVAGIKVQLVEKLSTGGEEIWQETTTGENGYYIFQSFIPGDYVVRFIYDGKEYNGQDYKSTSYQYNHINNTGIDQTGRTDISGADWPGYTGYTDVNNQNTSASFGYSIHRSDEYEFNLSDAKDIWDERLNVIDYSDDGVTNEIAQKLNDGTAGTNTQMIAETGAIRIEFEYNRQVSTGNNTYDNNGYKDTSDKQSMNYLNDNNTNSKYHLQNVDFGLEERPKAQLELNKKVSNVKIILANQTILFDTTQSVNNLIWQSKTPYDINSMKEETAYDTVGPEVSNGANNVYSDYTRYDDFRKAVADKISTLVTGQKGLIQATMDEEIMHGTTIQITYDMSVTNIGEEDYNETSFYYLGKVNDKNTLVKTSADLVIDYVANNLQFRKESNNNDWGWETITNQQIKNNGYVNTTVANELENFNTIITTKALNKALVPLTESRKNSSDTHDEIQLVLTQLITSQNKDDDLSYGNIAEIVKISNDVGRRMAYSVQGNQNPTTPNEIDEPDTSKAEQVIILPPFGEQYLYMGLGVLVAALLGISIIVIKKTVLNKNKF